MTVKKIRLRLARKGQRVDCGTRHSTRVAVCVRVVLGIRATARRHAPWFADTRHSWRHAPWFAGTRHSWRHAPGSLARAIPGDTRLGSLTRAIRTRFPPLRIVPRAPRTLRFPPIRIVPSLIADTCPVSCRALSPIPVRYRAEPYRRYLCGIVPSRIVDTCVVSCRAVSPIPVRYRAVPYRRFNRVVSYIIRKQPQS